MNLARHAAVVWRFRVVAAVGLSLGIVIALLASYTVSFSGGLTFTPRGSEVWSAVSSIHVTQPGFPEGRVTLPQTQTGGAVTSGGRAAVARNAAPKDQVQFADPGRLANLADLYSKFLRSAEVLARVPGRPKAAQIQASPFLASAGGQVLPIIELTTNADSERNARRLNLGIYDALRGILTQRQQANGIAVGERVELRLLDPPDVALTSGRSRTMAILALLLCILGTLAVVHILEALRRTSDSRDDDDAFAPVVPWTSTGPPRYDDPRPERRPAPQESDRGVPERQAAGGRRSSP